MVTFPDNKHNNGQNPEPPPPKCAYPPCVASSVQMGYCAAHAKGIDFILHALQSILVVGDPQGRSLWQLFEAVTKMPVPGMSKIVGLDGKPLPSSEGGEL